MKRTVALLMLMLMLSGCAISGSKIKDPITFHYLHVQSDDQAYDAYFAEGIMGTETREAAGRRDDLNYLLTVYFRGPLDPELASPFPMGCRILEILQQDGLLTLQLNPILAEMSDMEITVACACLAQTCMDLTDADAVQIESRNLEGKLLFSRTFTQDNLFLNDNYTQPVETTEPTQ